MISVPAFRRDFGYVFEGEYVIPAQWQTAINVISSPGGFFGGFLCSFLADRYGRKAALLVGVLFCTGGIIGQLVSTTRTAFLMSKLVLGFGTWILRKSSPNSGPSTMSIPRRVSHTMAGGLPKLS